MGFLVNRQVEPEPLGAQGGQTRAQSLLISLGLLYLAIPNILFLQGWFTPPVALTVSALILFSLVRAVVLSFRASSPCCCPSPARPLLFVPGLAVAVLVCAYFILRVGFLGFVPTFIDHYDFRNALFANLRDAAWPLILPNGKEMSYYLADLLPPALAARLAPASGQWAVVLWTLAGSLLPLLLIASLFVGRCRSWGRSLLIVALFFGVFCNPLISYSLGTRAIHFLREYADIDLGCLMVWTRLSCATPLSSCGILNNSFPPAFIVASLLLACRARQEVVLPLALALLVPLSPFCGIGLLPLIALRWGQGVRARGWRVSHLLDAPVPAAMAFVAGIYFTRGEGVSVAALTCVAWGWETLLRYEAWLLAGWLFVLLPPALAMKRDAFFYTLLACCLLMPFFFIGAARGGLGHAGNNELWMKSAPCYMVVIGAYWLAAWPRIGWCRHLFLGLCIAISVAMIALYAGLAWRGTHGYMQVDDRWNGHLNHDDSYFDMCVPPCKEPMLEGVMLREAGESERHFPGCLLPKAPGCDYSRPPAAKVQSVAAPL